MTQQYQATLRLFETLGGAPYEFVPFEAQRLTVLLLEHEIQNEDKSTAAARDFQALSRRFLVTVGEMMKTPLAENKELEGAIHTYFQQMHFRNRFGIHFKSMMEAEIKANCSAIFGVCLTALVEIETGAAFGFTDSDVAEIAMLISNGLHQTRSPAGAVLVTVSSRQASLYMAHKIQREVPAVRIDEIVAYEQVKQRGVADDKLVITTVPVLLRDQREDAILIHTDVDEQDVRAIQERVENQLRQGGVGQPATSFEEVFSREMIIADCPIKSKTLVIKLGCEMLIEQGCVTEQFEQDVLAREVFSPTAVGRGVAIPHGRQAWIKNTGIAVIQLRKPIEWTEEDKVNLVFVVALKAHSGHQVRGFMGTFYEMIDNPEVMEQLRQASTREDIWQVLRQFNEKV